MVRAAIYARFSSENQTEASIDAQVKICTNYCEKKNYTVAKIYTDEAKSGTTTAKRDSYKRMLADAKADVFDVIIFHKIDRNARNEYDYYQFKNKILSLGKSYEYAGQNVDNSPEGQLMENNLVGFAAYFSRNLSKEVKKGQDQKAENARFLGGKPPLGYKISVEKISPKNIIRTYVIDDTEAGAVRMIFTMYNDGYGYTDIIKALSNRGYKTKRGSDFGKNSLHDILKNERYKGIYFYGKRKKVNGKGNSHKWSEDTFKIENALPPIVSSELFDFVQRKMAKRKHVAGSFKAKTDYLLTGLVYDEHGNKMSGHTSGVKGKYRYSSYMVTSNKIAHNRLRIDKEELEKGVLELVCKNLTSYFVDNVLKRTAEILAESENSSAKELKTLGEKKTQAEKRLNNFYSVIEITGDAFDLARLAQIKGEITELNASIESLSQREPSVSPLELKSHWLRMVGDIKKETSPKAVKTLLERLVEKVIVKKKEFSVAPKIVHSKGNALALPLICTTFTKKRK